MLLFNHKTISELTKKVVYSGSASKLSFIQILIYNKYMSVGEEGLVVDLNEKDMGANSNRIELHEIEEDIRNNKEVWVCL